jgi:AcrR family transcriptional regulator
MPGKSHETKRRLLEAATAEFAAFGIAGGRVDRIAAAAGCNKQAIYAYFGSKEGLFGAVYDTMVIQTVESTPIDATDLAAYAGRLFDRYREHPEVPRLATWYQLEKKKESHIPSIVARATQTKLAAIRDAQKRGIVSKRFTAEDLLAFVLKLSTVGNQNSPEAVDVVNSKSRLRKTMMEAVKRLSLP